MLTSNLSSKMYVIAPPVNIGHVKTICNLIFQCNQTFLTSSICHYLLIVTSLCVIHR